MAGTEHEIGGGTAEAEDFAGGDDEESGDGLGGGEL